MSQRVDQPERPDRAAIGCILWLGNVFSCSLSFVSACTLHPLHFNISRVCPLSPPSTFFPGDTVSEAVVSEEFAMGLLHFQ